MLIQTNSGKRLETILLLLMFKSTFKILRSIEQSCRIKQMFLWDRSGIVPMDIIPTDTFLPEILKGPTLEDSTYTLVNSVNESSTESLISFKKSCRYVLKALSLP